jgi:hypothetical protein
MKSCQDSTKSFDHEMLFLQSKVWTWDTFIDSGTFGAFLVIQVRNETFVSRLSCHDKKRSEDVRITHTFEFFVFSTQKTFFRQLYEFMIHEYQLLLLFTSFFLGSFSAPPFWYVYFRSSKKSFVFIFRIFLTIEGMLDPLKVTPP